MIKKFEHFALDYIVKHFDNEDIIEMLRYSIKSGGKRFRPLLFLALFEHEANEDLFKIALALEFTHTYSLIHDDLPCMDNDLYRRGNLTLWNKYSQANALLIGDGLISQAFVLLAQVNLSSSIKIKLIEEFGLKTGLNGMVLGQYLDVNNKTKTKAQIDFMYQRKTGDMLALCFTLFAIIKGENYQKFEQLGYDLGVLFQYQDDYLEQFSLGLEQSNSDIRNHKNTFMNTYVDYELQMQKYKQKIQKQTEELNITKKAKQLINKILRRDQND